MATSNGFIRFLRQLGSQIEQHRVARGLSRPKLAEHVDADRTVVWRYEKGETPPSVEMLYALSAELGVPFVVDASAHEPPPKVTRRTVRRDGRRAKSQ